jgi:putative DNA primase/helicase
VLGAILLDDQTLIEKAQNAKDGAKFSALWSGNISGYKSQSEADLALCCLLAFWTGGNYEQIDRLFQQSGLFRADKWSEREDYRERTINAALLMTTEFYDPNYQSEQSQAVHYDTIPTGGFVTADNHDKVLDAVTEQQASPEILFTDGWNAKRFVREHGNDVRYCYEWGKWLVYDGKRWKLDNTGEVVRRAKQTIRRLYAQAAESDDDIERKLLADHAKKSDSKFKYQAMIELAQCEVPILSKDLDTNPMLVNCENGTIDLRTGELREHRREDFITKLAPVAYNPKADCAQWRNFLNRVMSGNPNLIDFLNRAIGYSLTGDISEQSLFFLYGTGANGKTVFQETIKGMLGDYAKEAEPEILIQKHNESHPTGVADLFGARFVSTTEVGEGRRMDETKVKQLTGGDRLKARFMRQDFFEFYPTHKIFLAANHKPIVRGTDYAIWRRIKLVPFEVTIPEKERIPFAKMLATLKAEWTGILAWAVQGCIEWQAQGLGTPTEVTKATQAYREEMDIIGDFFDEYCIIGVDAKAKASTLYTTYKTWCDANGEHVLTQKVFGSRLTERGFERKREKTGYFWLGIGILENLVNDPNDGSPSQETNGGAGFNEHEGRKVNHDEPFSGINETNCISPRLIQKNGSPSFTPPADDNHEASSSKGFDEVNDRSSSDEREVFII